MNIKPETIDTSAGRVHKNPIAELMQEAAECLDVMTSAIGGAFVDEYKADAKRIVAELYDTADEIERQEPVAWSGWGCQYPGKMPRLYGERRIAELNCDWESGDQLLLFTAAPQPAERSCEYCDGTGDVHSADGEWRGTCSCRAEQQPAPNDLIGRIVSMDVSTGDHDACHRLFGTVIGVEGRAGVILCELQEDNHDAEQQPDAAPLAEALDAALMVMTSKEVRLEKWADAITSARAAMAPYRKGGE